MRHNFMNTKLSPCSRDEIIRVPGFDEKQYWGEGPQAAMRHILWQSASVGPTAALANWCRNNNNNYILNYALDTRRALCLEMASWPEGGKVLDYGCGYGTIGLAAAQRAGEVFFVDSTLERLSFARERALEEGFSNCRFIAAQDWTMLPLADASLDLIVLNGVLEWVAAAPGNEDPAAVQMAFLNKMLSLLKPGATLFVGIENRFAARYLMGLPDDHSNRLFTSWMPRWMADLYMRARGQSAGYRTLTWSLTEIRRRFKLLGAGDLQVYSMVPDYRFPLGVARVDDLQALCHLHQLPLTGAGRRARLLRYVDLLLSRFNLLPFCTYSYGLVITKQ